ncbi:phospholipase-like protein [Tanacetum coccineum]|uniref:Phospholipase-like protein n=1 Tax=Tanacetum coccineum TaxID=301880 RepID=A0ABQ5FUT7_9ASTR
MLEEENSMKSIDHSNSTHMKLALEKCETTKRKYVNVLKTPMEVDTEIKGPNMDTLKNQKMDTLKNQKNVLDAYMIERCQDLKPWEEDLNRPFKYIDKIYCNYYLEQFLSSSGWRHCKFPWCNDVFVDRPFWDSLIGLDDNRLGWLHKEETGVFVSKGIDPTYYSIKFRHALNVPKQGRVFGDCGIFFCLFLYRLAHGIPLDVEDPIQKALRDQHESLPQQSGQHQKYSLMLEWTKGRYFASGQVDNSIYKWLEENIESVIGINKDDIDEEDDESSTMEPPSRNEAIKAAITLNNFLLSYEKTTPEVLTMLRKIRDEIQARNSRQRMWIFMWKDDLIRHLSFSPGPSTPPSSSLGPSTRPSYSPQGLRSALNLKKAVCSNCKFLAKKIKAPKTKIKIL